MSSRKGLAGQEQGASKQASVWGAGLAYVCLVFGVLLVFTSGLVNVVQAGQASLTLTITAPLSGQVEFGEVNAADDPVVVSNAVQYDVAINPSSMNLDWNLYARIDTEIPGCTLETRPSGGGSEDWVALTTTRTLLGSYSGNRSLSDDLRLTVEWWVAPEPYAFVITYEVEFTDVTPPHGCSVLINDGDAYTNDPDVTLSLSAYDNSGYVDAVCFSSDGEIWSEWRDYASTASWTLSVSEGDGEKTVWARFRDPVGNESAAVWDTIILDTVPPGISNVAVSSSTATGATITWDTDELADSRVRYSEAGTALWTWTPLGPDHALSHAAVLSGLIPGTEYLYCVISIDPAGNPAESPEGPTFWTLCEAPALTVDFTRVGTSPDYDVSLSWTASLNATGYKVYRKNVATGNVTEWAVGPGTTAFEERVTGPADYQYWVAALSGGGAGSASNSVEVNIPADTDPPVLEITGVTPDQRDCVITWKTWFDSQRTIADPATSQVYYRVYSETAPGPWLSTPFSSSLVTNHTVTLTGLTPKTGYEFYAESLDAAGNPGQSTVQRFTTVSDPLPPTNLRVTKIWPQGQKADFAWDPVATATSYKVYYRDVMDPSNPGPWVWSQPAETGTTHQWGFQNPGQVPAYKYEFIVIAVDSLGNESSPSNSVVLVKN